MITTKSLILSNVVCLIKSKLHKLATDLIKEKSRTHNLQLNFHAFRNRISKPVKYIFYLQQFCCISRLKLLKIYRKNDLKLLTPTLTSFGVEFRKFLSQWVSTMCYEYIPKSSSFQLKQLRLCVDESANHLEQSLLQLQI